jgi:eukaryotic-like serine/threonine-protein kinase
LPSGVPGPVATTLAAMLEPRPEDRPAPHEVAEALEPVLEAQPRHRLTFKVAAR